MIAKNIVPTSFADVIWGGGGAYRLEGGSQRELHSSGRSRHPQPKFASLKRCSPFIPRDACPPVGVLPAPPTPRFNYRLMEKSVSGLQRDQYSIWEWYCRLRGF